MNLSASEAGFWCDASEENSAALFITMEYFGSNTRGHKEKFVNSIQSIVNILRDQGEFQSAMEFYSEYLHMRRAMSASHQHPNGAIKFYGTLIQWVFFIFKWRNGPWLWLYLMSTSACMLTAFQRTILTWPSLFIKLEDLVKVPGNLIRPFSTIKNSLREHYTFTKVDVGVTEIFFYLGYIVLNIYRHSKLEVGDVTTVLEQDYFKLALECLSKAHNRYQGYCDMKVFRNYIKN